MTRFPGLNPHPPHRSTYGGESGRYGGGWGGGSRDLLSFDVDMSRPYFSFVLRGGRVYITECVCVSQGG